MQTDAELIDLVRQGELDAFGKLVNRYQRLVRSVALRVLADRHLADDVTQETFLVAFETLDSLRNVGKFGAWLAGIARNQAARTVRTLSRSPALAPEMESCADRNGQLSEPSRRLLELVDRLPDHERVVIGLRYFEGHSVQEIARITGRPLGTVTKQLSRAHGRLRTQLSKEMN